MKEKKQQLEDKQLDQLIPKVIEKIWAIFGKADNDELDKKEARQFMSATIAEMGSTEKIRSKTWNKMFAEMDVNKNGFVDKSEMETQIRKILHGLN